MIPPGLVRRRRITTEQKPTGAQKEYSIFNIYLAIARPNNNKARRQPRARVKHTFTEKTEPEKGNKKGGGTQICGRARARRFTNMRRGGLGDQIKPRKKHRSGALLVATARWAATDARASVFFQETIIMRRIMWQLPKVTKVNTSRV